MRHGAHGLLGHVLAGRMPGVGLSDVGLAQAARLAAVLGSRPITRVISSPLERAQQTAGPIGTRLGLPIQTEPDLTEIEFGAWTGQSFAALEGPAWTAWNTSRATAQPPGGETILAAQARAMAVMMRIAAEEPGEVVMVSHQDVIKAMLAYIMGSSLDLLHRFDLIPASRSVVFVGPGWARVDGMNIGVD